MEENKIKVYIKIDSNNCITNIESSIFLQDTTDWIFIEEGNGDKYAHAQGNYLPKEKPIRDNRGRCNYKYVDNKIIELTDEEKEILYPPIPPQKSELEKVKEDLKNSDSYLLKLSTLGIDEVKQLAKKLLETEKIVLDLQEQLALHSVK